ncbi:MAG: hypothetical protein AABX38_02775 [Candidatus Micrarchaeota archaeon]
MNLDSKKLKSINFPSQTLEELTNTYLELDKSEFPEITLIRKDKLSTIAELCNIYSKLKRKRSTKNKKVLKKTEKILLEANLLSYFRNKISSRVKEKQTENSNFKREWVLREGIQQEISVQVL